MAEFAEFLISVFAILGASFFAFEHFRWRSGNGRALVYVLVLLICSSALLDGAAGLDGLSAAGGVFMVSLALWLGFRNEQGETSQLYSGSMTSVHRLGNTLSFIGILLVWLWCPTVISLPVLLIGVALVSDLSDWKQRVALIVGAVFAVLLIGRAVLFKTFSWDFIEPLAYGFSPSLLGSNLLYFLGGRDVGVVVWYLPFFFLILCFRPGNGRGWLLLGLIAAAILRLAFEPHNFFGGPEAVGSGVFLALYVGAWYLPKQVPNSLVLGAMVLGSALFMWPAWLSPVATWRGDDRPALHEYSLASRLPYETTQEFVPYSTEWQGTGVLSRSLGPGLEDSGRGPVLVPDNGPAELMIAAERPLEAVLLDFGPEAKSEIKVRGGEVGNVVFKPDGGVRFEVTFGEPNREHRMWWSEKTHYIYLFDFEMPGAAGASLPVAILARPKEALPRSLDSSSAALPWPAEVEGVELSELPEPSVLFEPAEPEGVS